MSPFIENIYYSGKHFIFFPPPNENFSLLLLLFWGFDDCFRFQNNNNNYYFRFFPDKKHFNGKKTLNENHSKTAEKQKTKQKNHFVSQTHTHTHKTWQLQNKTKKMKFCTEFVWFETFRFFVDHHISFSVFTFVFWVIFNLFETKKCPQVVIRKNRKFFETETEIALKQH